MILFFQSFHISIEQICDMNQFFIKLHVLSSEQDYLKTPYRGENKIYKFFILCCTRKGNASTATGGGSI